MIDYWSKYDVRTPRLKIHKSHYLLEIDLYFFTLLLYRSSYNLPRWVVTGIVRCRGNFPFHVVGSADNNPYLINMKYNLFLFFSTGEKQNRFSVPHVRIAKLNKIKKTKRKKNSGIHAHTKILQVCIVFPRPIQSRRKWNE